MPPQEFFWLDTLSCGHIVLVELAVDIDRDQNWADSPLGRIGSPTCCYTCEPRDPDVLIMATRRVPNDELTRVQENS